MRRGVELVALLALVGLVGGCADKYESAVQEQIAQLERLTDVLGDVRDAASAKAAAPKLEALSGKLKGAADLLSEAPAERKAELKKKYEKDIMQAFSDMVQQMKRIQTLKGVGELDNVFKAVKQVKPDQAKPE